MQLLADRGSGAFTFTLRHQAAFVDECAGQSSPPGECFTIALNHARAILLAPEYRY